MSVLKFIFIEIIVLTFFLYSCKNEPDVVQTTKSYSYIPGTVIDHLPKSSGLFLGSPSICIMPNGDYIASCDLNSIDGTNITIVNTPQTLIFKSIDKGMSWTKIATISGQFWSELFYYNDALYVLGTSKSGGSIYIRKSIDSGQVWSTPTDSTNGIIAQDAKYHCAPTPIVHANGRLWRGMEDLMGGGTIWGQSFRSFMLSAPDNANLLLASSWTKSNRLSYNSSYLNGDFGGWLEGNAVVTQDANLVNILRTNYQLNGDEKASIITISKDGKKATFDPNKGFIDFPGGCKKFAVRYDSISGKYWSLSNYVPDIDKGHNAERTRNTQALLCSTDLYNWSLVGIVLHHPDIDYHGFQYVDFLFEGNDIVAVSRTAYDDEEGNADSQHNANFFTFHRIQNFRNYSTPMQWRYLLPLPIK
jgi:hypothetical protein